MKRVKIQLNSGITKFAITVDNIPVKELVLTENDQMPTLSLSPRAIDSTLNNLDMKPILVFRKAYVTQKKLIYLNGCIDVFVIDDMNDSNDEFYLCFADSRYDIK
jgi:hypothetical protein